VREEVQGWGGGGVVGRGGERERGGCEGGRGGGGGGKGGEGGGGGKNTIRGREGKGKGYIGRWMSERRAGVVVGAGEMEGQGNGRNVEGGRR